MTIVDTIKSLPETLKKVEIADLQKQASELATEAVTTAKTTYADVTKRGEELVGKAKGFKVEDLKKTVATLRTKAESGVEDVTKQAKGFADDAQKRAESLVDDAKETVAKVTGQAKPAAKPAAKKAPAKPAAKKAPAKKAPAKKAPAKKPAAKKA